MSRYKRVKVMALSQYNKSIEQRPELAKLGLPPSFDLSAYQKKGLRTNRESRHLQRGEAGPAHLKSTNYSIGSAGASTSRKSPA